MDTKHLITFITFAEEKTYLKTSMKLNYAPSTLAEHIGALEQELGAKLVESHGKRTTLTKRGELFLPYAKQLMKQYKISCQMLASYDKVQGVLRILTVESLALHGLSGVFAKFTSRYPDVQLSVGIANCDSMMDKLKEDQTDVVFFYDMEPVAVERMRTTILFKEDLLFVVSPKHKLAKKQHVRPKDFALQTFVLAQKDSYYAKAFNQMLQDNRVTIQKRLELDSGNLIKEYVKAGNGIAILPRSVVSEELKREELVILDWEGRSWEVYAQAVSRDEEWIPPAAEKLVETAQLMVNGYCSFRSQ